MYHSQREREDAKYLLFLFAIKHEFKRDKEQVAQQKVTD
jgi:hypothetical protein